MFKKLAISLVAVFALASCATIMNDGMVSVPVHTTPAGAKLLINGTEYTSPATVQAPRGKGDFNLHIEMEGYEPVDIMLTQSLDGWLWGNIVFGGLIGLAVDFASGDAYDLDPELVSSTLQGKNVTKLENGGLNVVLVDIRDLPKSVAAKIKAKKLSRNDGFVYKQI